MLEVEDFNEEMDSAEKTNLAERSPPKRQAIP